MIIYLNEDTGEMVSPETFLANDAEFNIRAIIINEELKNSKDYGKQFRIEFDNENSNRELSVYNGKVRRR